MKINLIPSKKLALLSAAFCAVMLACSDNASALTLTVGDNQYLGQIIPGTGGNAQRTAYVNHMIGMNLGGFDLFMSQPFFRSTNNFGSLPTAVFALNGTGTNISLGTGLYSYLFAQYSGISFVWYVGNLSGNVQIPLVTTGGLLMGWTLFSAGGQGVPDGGTTAMLLGAALGALGITRRYLMSYGKGVFPSSKGFPLGRGSGTAREWWFFLEYLVHAMLFPLLGATTLLGAVTGFIELSEGAFFKTLGGQIVQGMLSIVCFIFVGVAFWRFGWKIGLLDLLLVIVASNVGLALRRGRLPGQ